MRRGEKAVKSNGRTASNMKKLLILIACMAFLSGCTESTIVKPTAETVVGNPNFETSGDIVIDWKQVSSEAEELFEDTAAYPYSKDFRLYLEPKKKEIMLIWVVADDLPDTEICNYAEDLIKGFNDTVAIQDFSIEKSGVDSYGGLWKNYTLSYSIVPESTEEDENTWFISGNYVAGTDFKLPSTADLMAGLQAQGEDAGVSEGAESEEE